jgi:hypothetical protein
MWLGSTCCSNTRAEPVNLCLSLWGVSGDSERPALRIVASTVIADPAAPVFTVKDVADACGLPQPVIAQLVPRSWADDGWM